jgi:lipoprotein-anchoring transpeptidase ErfK/SrfK
MFTPNPFGRRSLLVVSFVTVLGAGLAACSGSGTSSTPASSAHSSTSVSAGTALKSGDGFTLTGGVVAKARGPLDVFNDLDASGPVLTLPAHTTFGSPTTLLVNAWQGPDGAWLRVSLPTRPNGSTGYVRTAAVELASVTRRIDVDLAAKHLRVFDPAGTVVLESAVAVGSPENPTPAGSYFVTDVIDTQNDGGDYGPFAIGVSAHSDTLTEFNGGDGEIGIHGTNNPASIGNAVSHGCVRLPNHVVVQLAGMIALGTPVTIR